MALPTIALPEARNALSDAAGRFADLLRSLPDTRATIPGSGWTAGDAAAHVVMSMRTEARVAAGEAVSWAQGATSAPGTPRGVAELNARAVTAEAERHPVALADMLVTAVSDFLAASAKLPPDHPMPSQYFQGRMTLDLAGVTGLELGEMLVHGYDVAKATGQPWPVPSGDARLALRAALRIAPAYVNPATARGHTGGYDLRIRGGPRLVVRFTDGRASLEQPASAPVDCHILAAPAALLLVLYGRTSQWGPIAKGQLVTWGRQPWRPWASGSCSLTPDRYLRAHPPCRPLPMNRTATDFVSYMGRCFPRPGNPAGEPGRHTCKEDRHAQVLADAGLFRRPRDRRAGCRVRSGEPDDGPAGHYRWLQLRDFHCPGRTGQCSQLSWLPVQ